VIPLVEVVGSAGTPLPAQMVIDMPRANVGRMFEFTVTVNVTGSAQIPGAGVNVYVPEF
jgi:hypothetical protein